MRHPWSRYIVSVTIIFSLFSTLIQIILNRTADYRNFFFFPSFELRKQRIRRVREQRRSTGWISWKIEGICKKWKLQALYSRSRSSSNQEYEYRIEREGFDLVSVYICVSNWKRRNVEWRALIFFFFFFFPYSNRLKGILKNLRSNGLSDYKVNQGDFMLAGLKVDVGLLFNQINVMTDYNVTGTLVDSFSIFGNGNIR